ncbi:MAG: flagellar export chaperone FlgN [Planctomycetota bacterium]|nr:flagellar export chaperone FlgN [Planctomycetota bacterium]
MSVSEIISRVEHFVPELERTQVELTRVFDLKSVALRAADSASLKRLTQTEAALIDQLRRHLSTRQQILGAARQEGLPAESITQLIESTADSTHSKLKDRIRRAERNAERLRKECWIQWIVCNRAIGHCGEVLELISHKGRKAPTYSGGLMKDVATGGSLLDASI